MQTTSPSFCADTGNGNDQRTASAFCQPADIAREGHCHVATVRRISAFLNLSVSRTGTGTRIFTREQARAILVEIERRKVEAMR